MLWILQGFILLGLSWVLICGIDGCFLRNSLNLPVLENFIGVIEMLFINKWLRKWWIVGT
jgi:hypothetical protein